MLQFMERTRYLPSNQLQIVTWDILRNLIFVCKHEGIDGKSVFVTQSKLKRIDLVPGQLTSMISTSGPRSAAPALETLLVLSSEVWLALQGCFNRYCHKFCKHFFTGDWHRTHWSYESDTRSWMLLSDSEKGRAVWPCFTKSEKVVEAWREWKIRVSS